MAFIELESPRPRTKPLRAAEGQSLRVLRTHYLPTPFAPPRVDMFAAMGRRRTLRKFGRLDETSLSAFLWHAARTQGAWINQHGERREWRPSPSAGACHPHDVLVLQRARGSAWKAAVYNPQKHALEYFSAKNHTVSALVKAASTVLHPGQGTLLFMAGNADRTARYYACPESLMWRDAGALLGVMSLVAVAQRLAFCPLGLTGEPHVSRLLRLPNIAGYGGAVLGKPLRTLVRRRR